MSSGTCPRPKRPKSFVWSHFKQQDKKTAKCNYCGRSINYASTITNLRKHLERKHKSIDLPRAQNLKPEEEDDDDIDDHRIVAYSPHSSVSNECQAKNGFLDASPRPKRSKSFLWSHFEQEDTIKKIAKCNYCAQRLNYATTTTNLRKHLERRHESIDLPRVQKLKPDDDDDDNDNHKLGPDSPPNSVSNECQVENSFSDICSRPKRSKISFVWSHFKQEDTIEKIAKCNYCEKRLNYSNTTTNLRRHLEKRHKNIILPKPKKLKPEGNEIDSAISSIFNEYQVHEVYVTTSAPSTSNEVVQVIAPLNESTFSKLDHSTKSNEVVQVIAPFNESTFSKLDHSTKSSKSKKLNKLLLQLFIRHYHPVSIIEDEAFINFINGLNPTYKLPSKKEITNALIPAEYEKCFKDIYGELFLVKNASLSIEFWASEKQNRYMDITAHYIGENFALRSVLLESKLVPTSPTNADLAKCILNVTEKFTLTSKVSVIVSDNDSNITDIVTTELKKEHFSCFAHTINAILRNALKAAEELIDKIRSIVAHFKENPSSLETLHSMLKTSDKRDNKLILDVPIRWNSTFYMIQRFSEFHEAIEFARAVITEELPILSDDEWTTCKELSIVLEPFGEITEELCNEHYLLGSLLIPITNGLKVVCEKMQQEQQFGPVTKRVLEEICQGLNSEMLNIEDNKSFALATFLDPRIKLMAFLNENSAEAAKEYCTKLVSDIWTMQQQGNNCSVAVNHNSSSDDGNANISVGRLVKFSIWENLDKKIASKRSSGSMSAAMIEVNRYMEDTFLGRKEDPLLWWKKNLYHYPLMSKLVKTKFNLVGTSLPCERLFTKAGNRICERRSRLKTKNIDKILFLNANSSLVS